MQFRRAAPLALLLAAAVLPAAAQDAYCLDPATRQLDRQATATFQQVAQQADPQLMGMLVGVWQAELRAPATNQVDTQYRSFEPGGLFEYRSRVCNAGGGPCSDYQGTGLYAVRGMGDGSFFGLIIVSDLQRDHLCVSLAGRFADRGTLVAQDGTAWRRVR